MRCRIVLLTALLAGIPSLTQSASPSATDEDAIVASAQTAVVRALDYKQGDRASLMDAKDDFTAAGWSEFMKRMEGWLDDKGAPLGSETFTPSGDAVVNSRENGVIRLSIPGTFKQRQNASKTTYRVKVDVQLGGNPIKIEHLETITGGGAAGRDRAADTTQTIYTGASPIAFSSASLCRESCSCTALSIAATFEETAHRATAAGDRLMGAARFGDGA